MSHEWWDKVEKLFHTARELSAESRSRLLDQECSSDHAMRRKIEALLEQDGRPETFFDKPPLASDGHGFAPGARLGPYEVLDQIGAGGMGKVFRAHDSRLKRDVAIKALPAEYALDPERLLRFEREARLLASLNHPNIAAIHDVVESGPERYLVLELVDGSTLAERLKQGPIPVKEALRIARQIADALEAAHEKRIVHRDLKPANVKITPDGKVKVLDFGLAKPVQSEPVASESVESITYTQTDVGAILGTARYMSPEQARGQAVDRRTDIFAFGCVLYEMLTGKPAFEGQDVTEILSRVLQCDPDWAQLPSSMPRSIKTLIQLCLAKDVKNRRQTAGDLRIDLQVIESESDATIQTAPTVRNARSGWLVAAAMVGVLIGAFAGYVLWNSRIAPAPEMRVEIITPFLASPYRQFALSPDGKQLVYVSSKYGPQKLWLRPLGETDARPIAGTEGADFPFWSPDSRSIGFFAFKRLYRIDINGGPPQPLANVQDGLGGAWNADGVILFNDRSRGPLYRTTVAGGEPTPVTELDVASSGLGHQTPEFLRDGRHFVFRVTRGPEVYLGSLDGGQPKRLTAFDGQARVYDDLLLFVQQGSLIAMRLDLQLAELKGDPITLAENVDRFSVSNDGRIAYLSKNRTAIGMVWFDRTGKALGYVESGGNDTLWPDLSPDDQYLAVHRRVQGKLNIWMLDLARNAFTRLTSSAPNDQFPIWSPDGKQVAFISNRKGPTNLYVKSANGMGEERLVWETPYNKAAMDWSPDGRFLLYYENNPKTLRDLLALDLTASEPRPIVVAGANFDENGGQFSPDGRWVAYRTNESGRSEVVLQEFPEPTRKLPVSINGGNQPRWRSDGTELYFVGLDGTMMAVPITRSGSKLKVGLPVSLFSTRIYDVTVSVRPQYVVTRDGRFLINQEREDSDSIAITLILNWKP